MLPQVDTLLLMTEHSLLHGIAKGVRAVIAAGVTVILAATTGVTVVAVILAFVIVVGVVPIAVVVIGVTSELSVRAMLGCFLL